MSNKNSIKHSLLLTSAITAASIFSAGSVMAAEKPVIKPALMTKQEIKGDIFKRPDLIVEKHANGNQTLDVISLLSSDKKFVSGMYKAGASHDVATEAQPYGVDEYMYFLEGSVTLTSSDGTVTEIKAGDAVTLPKEWTGIWDTQGYTKIYVIYSPDEPMD